MEKQITERCLQILHTLAKFRIATRPQLEAIHGLGATTDEAFRSLIKCRRIGFKETPLRANGDWEDVYYLMAAGEKIVHKHYPALKNHSRRGYPTGVHLQRLEHDLLVTETLCWFAARTTVVGYLTEDELKRRGERPADLRVFTIDSNGEATMTDCEVVRKNTRQKIKQKDGDLIYFTDTLLRADAIESIKKWPVHVLTLKLRPRTPFVFDKDLDASVLPELEQAVHQRIGQIHFPFTAAGMAGMFQFDAAKTSGALKNLYEHGLLQRETVQVEPGNDTGAPNVLYAHKRLVLDEYPARIYGLLLSKLVERASQKGFRLTNYDPKTRGAFFQLGYERRAFLIDNPWKDVTEIAEYFERVIEYCQTERPMKATLVPANSERYEAFKSGYKFDLADLVAEKDFEF